MRKKIKKEYTFVVLLLFTIFCFYNGFYLKKWSTWEEKELQYIMTLENINSDAKFLGDIIVTSENSKLKLYDIREGKYIDYPEIDAMWIYVVEEENLVFYANWNNQIGLAYFDESGKLVKNNIIMKTSNLCIDPAIIKIDGIYYCTLTEIIGNVNNSNPNAENGRYTIKLYRSNDLNTLEYVTDVVTYMKNIEDVDLAYEKGNLYIVYEKETLDKGNSSIEFVTAKQERKGFRKFSSPYSLLDSDCDHEPASFVKEKDGTYTLYYSSDNANVGQSYEGADLYYAKYNCKWERLACDVAIKSQVSGGKCLYDVINIDGKNYYVYVSLNNGNRSLVIEKESK